MSIKAVIFDMDGTLIDSQEAVLGAFRHVLGMHGQTYDETTLRTHVGRLLEQTYQVLAPDYDAKQLADLHRSWQVKHKHLLKGFEGLDGFLDALKKRGLKLGAFTSATRARTDLVLGITKVEPYFDVIICGDEVTNPKPDKEGIVTAARHMHIELSEVVMVGDAEHDILSGKNAGVVTMGITHGFGTKAALKRARADYVVHNLQELLELIQKLQTQ